MLPAASGLTSGWATATELTGWMVFSFWYISRAVYRDWNHAGRIPSWKLSLGGNYEGVLHSFLSSYSSGKGTKFSQSKTCDGEQLTAIVPLFCEIMQSGSGKSHGCLLYDSIIIQWVCNDQYIVPKLSKINHSSVVAEKETLPHNRAAHYMEISTSSQILTCAIYISQRTARTARSYI